MNKRQILVLVVSCLLIGFSLFFPPKVLIRNEKVIMRVMPFEEKTIEGRGILIKTSYWDKNFSHDWQRLIPFIALIIFVCGILCYSFRRK